MQIIDRNKDFYDFYSQVYGVDKNITFDRRGSTLITDEKLVRITDYTNKKTLFHREHFLFLEVGLIQYLIMVSDIKTVENCEVVFFDSCEFTIMKVYEENRHFFDSPISIRKCIIGGRWGFFFEKYPEYKNTIPSLEEAVRMTKIRERYLDNPILAGTSLTKILDAFELWKSVQAYFSSLLNDKDIDIKMDDKKRAETHGFNKFSFRHPIK